MKRRRSDLAIFLAFCLLLIVGLLCGLPTWAPLLGGMALFAAAALVRGSAPADVARKAGRSAWNARSVMITLGFIGFLTALWRSSGTIAVLIDMVSPILMPQVLPLATFAACAAVSVLTGTAFGTAATAGAVCLAVASTCDASLALCGGAALAGCYFGDRCSPVSTSALLVSELTGTDIRRNIPAMLRSCIAPTLLSAGAYALLGLVFPAAGAQVATPDFSAFPMLGPVPLVPAISILVLAIAGVGVKANIAVSCALAYAVTVFGQGEGPLDAALWMVAGCSSQAATATGLLGGGLVSMLPVLAIIAIASTYPGLLGASGISETLRALLMELQRKVGEPAATTVASAVFACIACNQTLSIMLVHQVSDSTLTSRQKMLALEDTVVVMAPLVPWSIASAVPLASMGVGVEAIPFAFFLYLLPLWANVKGKLRRRA